MTMAGTRRTLPIARWPDIDRRLWEAAKNSAYVVNQKPTSIAVIADVYGRWIAFLSNGGQLDERTHPVDRVTPARVDDFVDQLRDAGNQNITIEARLLTLAAALRILAPSRVLTWLHPCTVLRGQNRRGRPLDNNDPTRNWPELDRRLWTTGLQPGDILRGPHYAETLRPATIHNSATGYRSWLAFLRVEGMLDPLVPPMARVTQENVVAYIHALRARNRNSSIIQRIGALRSALRVMHPEVDFGWLTSPGGQSLASWLPVSTRPIQAIDSKVLYEWGLATMRDGLSMGNPDARRREYRNGLMIALFAARAPRVRSMMSLRLGVNVIRSGGTYRFIFENDDIKTARRVAYDAPAGLTDAIERYITVEREELLAGKTHDWLWVNQYGEPLTVDYISTAIHVRSGRYFGTPFGPHRFRHAMGTTAPMADPAHPGVAAAILGISGHTVEKHYNRASQADVALKFHASIRKDRARLRSIAGREFRGNG